MSFYGLFGGNAETRDDSGINNPGVSLAEIIDGPDRAGTGFAGEHINEDSAFCVSSVWAAVNFISDSIAALPLSLYKKTDEGRLKADKDPLYRIIHDVVNANLLTSFQFRKRMLTSYLLSGRAYAFIERDRAGRVTNLWDLPTDQVKPVVDTLGRMSYVYTPNASRSITYQPNEMIDLVWQYASDKVSHINPLHKLRNVLGLTIGAERFGSILFEAGGVVPLVLTTNVTAPGAAARAGNDVNDALKRARNRKHNVMVMPPGAKLDPIGVDPDKLQTLDLRKFQVIEVARFFGIPPIFIQDLSTGTYSNTEQQDLHWVKHRLGQLCQMFEQELNVKLFPAKTNGVRYVEFNVDGLLRGDFETRMAGYSSAIQSAVLTPNEAREMENRPAQDGGDELWIMNQVVPLAAQVGYDPNKQVVPSVDNPITDPDANDADDPEPTPDISAAPQPVVQPAPAPAKVSKPVK